MLTNTSEMTEEQMESARLVTRGNHQLFQQNFSGAISIFDQAVEIGSECIPAFQGRAFCKRLIQDEISSENLEDHLRSTAADLARALALTLDTINFLVR
jgi:hypothetical protein